MTPPARGPRHQTLQTCLTMRLLDLDVTGRPIPTRLSYRTDRPMEVSALFDDAGHQACWTIGRDLLLDGAFGPVGTGQVCVWPCVDCEGTATTVLELSAPDQRALVEVSTQALLDFLDATLDLVPRGVEGRHLDLDAELRALLTR